LHDLKGNNNTQTERLAQCNNCGATTTLAANISSDKCPFCASPLVISSENKTIAKPHYVLPFIVQKEVAQSNFTKWLKGLYFAPSDLLIKVQDEASSPLQGMYIPHWCYDTVTYTQYTGQRGEYYYVTVSYTEDGKRQTREERRTRWYPASGVVGKTFKDILISASNSLPQKTATTLEPWNLTKLVAYDERFLSGFRSETYRLEPEKAFDLAKQKMDPEIRNAICNDIGGDTQSINNYKVQYNDVGIKYILLPVWISAYRYNGKLFQFTVNACTGEVVGERPWSVFKIALATLAGIAIIALIYYWVKQN
jgi:predicted nucleic acid binding AN1-type Zn finger protein